MWDVRVPQLVLPVDATLNRPRKGVSFRVATAGQGAHPRNVRSQPVNSVFEDRLELRIRRSPSTRSEFERRYRGAMRRTVKLGLRKPLVPVQASADWRSDDGKGGQPFVAVCQKREACVAPSGHSSILRPKRAIKCLRRVVTSVSWGLSCAIHRTRKRDLLDNRPAVSAG